jgi:O-methyltransferase
MKRLNGIIKDFLLFTRIALVLAWLSHFFKFMHNLIGLTKWISKHKKGLAFDDSYRFLRNYPDRKKLYKHTLDTNKLTDTPIQYLEFGVFGGDSFRWWLDNNKHADSTFHGFDTFEGLPEDWGFYNQGDMHASMPEVADKRGQFVKGLFQHTLLDFIKTSLDKTGKRKVIHLDADLFSSTLFVLTSLAPYLQDGDLILFDEFSVPNHEYFAWDLFTKTYYVDFEVIGAVNNFFQIAIRYKGMGKFD